MRLATRRPADAALARRRRALGLVALVATPLVLSGCTLSTFGVHPGVTSQGHESFRLWQGFTIGAIVVGGITLALIVYAALRFRRRRDASGVPRQSQYHLPMEITYTVLPIIIVLILFGYTVAVEDTVTALPKPDVTIKVEAFQWGWKFYYPGFVISGQTTQSPIMRMPVGETVRIDLTSIDVIHAFYVPEFNFGRQAIPGIDNEFTFNAQKTGMYFGQCVQLCGLYHSLMNFRVDVLPTSGGPGVTTYADWLKASQKNAAALNAAARLAGRQLQGPGVGVRPYIGGGTN